MDRCDDGAVRVEQQQWQSAEKSNPMEGLVGKSGLPASKQWREDGRCLTMFYVNGDEGMREALLIHPNRWADFNDILIFG